MLMFSLLRESDLTVSWLFTVYWIAYVFEISLRKGNVSSEYLLVTKTLLCFSQNDQFVLRDTQDVFRYDSLSSSHPVYVPVSHPDEISQIFDKVSYLKVNKIRHKHCHKIGTWKPSQPYSIPYMYVSWGLNFC